MCTTENLIYMLNQYTVVSRKKNILMVRLYIRIHIKFDIRNDGVGGYVFSLFCVFKKKKKKTRYTRM